VFKRRRPDEPPAPEPPRPQLFNPGAEAPPGSPPANPILQPDRPAMREPESALAPSPTSPAVPKETSPMARPPFAATPAPLPSSTPGMLPGSRPPGLGPTPGPGPARPLQREPAERRTLVVGHGISVQGTVQDAERLVVEGTVEATMIRATELAVSPGGVFKGEIEVEDAEVAGTIDGTVTARGSLVVRSTGRVLGTAHCRRLQVEDGGQITGRIEMIVEGAPARVVETH
jgi:cytoskeletal protein CcmA (bactofilin family)